MSEPARADADVREALVRHVIVRACWACGHARQAGEPCAGCGLADPPLVHDLGVQAYTHRNPLRRLWWAASGQYVAARRARQANRYVAGVNDQKGIKE